MTKLMAIICSSASLRRSPSVSMGQVQHYVTTKDEMLLFAFQMMSALHLRYRVRR
ncbi:MAG: hypothetical protein ACRDYD_01925 [Acidimicrobiales bacterium]